MSEIVVVMFSKDRPLQCNLALNSFAYHCKDYYGKMYPSESFRLKVIYYASNDQYLEAYKKLENEHDYIGVEFIQQVNFKKDVLNCLKNYKYVLFLVDDNVFFDSFGVKNVSNILEENKNMIGFSYRLGENISYSYAHDIKEIKPKILKVYKFDPQDIITFDWTISSLDFGYALELSSSLYRIEDILPILEVTSYGNPNNLEWNMFLNLGHFFIKQKILASYKKSVAFCSPMNKVQTVNNNRFSENNKYSPESLLKIFDEGYRVRFDQFDGFVPQSCHQEFDFLKELRKIE